MTPFEEIGGEPALRRIIDQFVDRCFEDVMIGFLFRRAAPERIKRFEYEHAAEFLGAGVHYAGRPLDRAHARHAILGGQFARRLQILREVLEEQRVPAQVRDAWLAHQDALKDEVTSDPVTQCNDQAATSRLRGEEKDPE